VCVNYYEHHLGDYARDAGKLSMLRDGAYFRLMGVYYGRELPLPLELAQVFDLTGCASKVEQDAVEYILKRFFYRGEDGYHQKRCDEEIARFKAKSEAAKVGANARWSHNGRNANGMRSHSDGNALQSPVSSLQKPITKKEKRGREDFAASPPPARLPLDFELTEEREEIAITQGIDPELTFAKFTDHFTAAAGTKGLKADWNAAWRIWCRDEAAGNFGSGSRKAHGHGNGQDDAATQVWNQLVASDGAKPKRNGLIQAALDAAGGWPAVRMRNEFESVKLKSAFCEAYRTLSAVKSPGQAERDEIEREEAARADG
jgi:uncharacterized protein YdaU (DUF1376 family)